MKPRPTKVIKPEIKPIKPILVKKPIAVYKCPTCATVYKKEIVDNVCIPGLLCTKDRSLMEARIE